MNPIRIVLIMAACWLAPVLGVFAQSNLFQSWADKYQHTATSTYSNEGSKLVVDDASGNIFTLVDVTSDLDMSGNVTGNTYNYVVLAKYNSSGSILDSRVIDVSEHTTMGFDSKSAFGMNIDLTGNLFIGYNKYDVTTNYDVVVAKYSASTMNLIWTNTFNSTTYDRGIDMTLSPSGSVYAVVAKTGITGNPRYAIVKASGTGISAGAFYSLTPDDQINSIACDVSNNVYVTGFRTVNTKKTLLTLSVNSTGNLRWIRQDTYDVGNGDNIGKHIIIGADGAVYVTGSTVGTVQHGLDVVTLKIAASNGKLSWENIINFGLTDGGIKLLFSSPNVVYVAWQAGNSVFVDMISSDIGQMMKRATYSPIPATAYVALNGATIADMKLSSLNKNVYLTGSLLATGSGNQQFSSGFLIKLDFSSRASGSSVVAQMFMDGTLTDSNKNVAIALDNNNTQVYILQDQFSTFSTHADEFATLLSIDAPNRFRIEDDNASVLLEPGSINIYSLNSGHTSIQANFNIKFVEIYDLTGKKVIVKETNSTNNFMEIDNSSLVKGIYLIRVFSETGIQLSKKFVKN